MAAYQVAAIGYQRTTQRNYFPASLAPLPVSRFPLPS